MEGTGSGDFGHALELHRAGRLDDAEAAYLKLLVVSPRHPDLLRLLGLLRFQRGRGDEAVACCWGRRSRRILISWMAGGPWRWCWEKWGVGRRHWFSMRRLCGLLRATLRSSMISAVRCLKRGGWIDAAEMLRLAVDLDPEHGDALTNLAAVLNRMRRSLEAAEVIGHAVALRPDHAGVLGVLSAVLASNGDYVGAETAAHRAIWLQDTDADAWVQLGNISIDVGKVDAAAEAYGKAVELAPG